MKRRARDKFKGLLQNFDEDIQGDDDDGAETQDPFFASNGNAGDGQEEDIVFESSFGDAGEKILQKVQEKEAAKKMTDWEMQVKRRKERTEKRKRLARQTGGTKDDIGSEEDEEPGSLRGPIDKSKKKKRSKSPKSGVEREKKRAEAELLTMGEDTEDHNGKGYSLRQLEARFAEEKQKISRKKKKNKNLPPDDDAEDNFAVDLADKRFAPLFSNPEFAIDPTSPSFKKTKGTHEILKEHTRRVADSKASTKREVERKRAKIKGVLKDPRLMSIIGRVKASTAKRNKRKTSK